MKLRNKKTGKIGNFCYGYTNELCVSWQKDDGFWEKQEYNSLAELNADWCDYEDRPYVIDMWEDDCICDAKFGVELEGIERAKECGLYFETKEEAEKAVEKLKAWKRLKDKGFVWQGWEEGAMDNGMCVIGCQIPENNWETDVVEDLDLLFSGEDD